MCIQFAKSQGSYDFVSPFINVIGNGLVVAAAGCATGVIVSLALKALGYSGAAIAIGSAVPFAAGLIGLGCAAVAALALAGFFLAIAYALSRR